MNKLYQSLYDEFGEIETHRTRREVTATTGNNPSYIELLTALSLKRGYQPEPIKPIFTADVNDDKDMELLGQFFGRDALDEAFAGKNPHEQIKENAAIASFIQAINNTPAQPSTPNTPETPETPPPKPLIGIQLDLFGKD